MPTKTSTTPKVQIDPPAADNPFKDIDPLPSVSQARDWLYAEALRRGALNQTAAARLLGVTQPAISQWLRQRGVRKRTRSQK